MNCMDKGPSNHHKERRLSSRSNSGESDDIIETARIPTSTGRRKRNTSVSEPISVIQTTKRAIYTAGRPPWYNEQGEQKEAFIIGLSGGSASGKTTVAEKIIQALDFPWVVLLSMDSFYKVLTPEQHEIAEQNEYDFDHIDAFDFDLCCETLGNLKQGKKVEIPMYDFTTHARKKNTKTLYGANVVIFEGIMSFVKPELREILDMKVFVDADSDERLARRLRRDITQRGRNLQGVLHQYHKFVKPAFEQFIEPTIQYADIVVPRGGSNEVAIDLIAQHVHTQLEIRNLNFRSQLANAHIGQPLPSTLHVLDNTPQVQGIHTILRDQSTSRDDFVFYSKRLMRLLFEFALSFLPHSDHKVETPQDKVYDGRKFSGTGLCGMSILRAGETMEPALFSVTKDIRLGKILIQTNLETNEPELHYIRVPRKIHEDHVILMDATVATGAAAMMAIRVLLDHDVKEENILLVSLLMAETGVHSVAYAFPRVQIITTAVDKQLDSNYHIIPGLGNFGDRYFGTE
uniref:Uridine-cytidine kinase n=1 Tax=Phallusia mammillata TaxID=59560 RepID=A0A6F9DWY6_9ASCI|nr:uridine-cytidine kinase-like 1 [Phallusia mammillata]